jgi:hypothetical protein
VLSCRGVRRTLTPRLQAAHFVRRIVGIILHEPFAVLADMNNLSTQRLLINARACSNIAHSVFNSNMDVVLMLAPLTPRTCFPIRKPVSSADPRAVYVTDCSKTGLGQYTLTVVRWLFVAVRAILMFYQHALEIGDRQSAQNLFVEVDVFL